MQLHVALGELLEHVLCLSGDVELRLEVLDLGLSLLELDGHVVEVACERGRASQDPIESMSARSEGKREAHLADPPRGRAPSPSTRPCA